MTRVRKDVINGGADATRGKAEVLPVWARATVLLRARLPWPRCSRSHVQTFDMGFELAFQQEYLRYYRRRMQDMGFDDGTSPTTA
jgi:hypothetical protein